MVTYRTFCPNIGVRIAATTTHQKPNMRRSSDENLVTSQFGGP
ncbi:MAG TPA: hypothetical protein VGE97_02010 [Nitrososphaera sp.]